MPAGSRWVETARGSGLGVAYLGDPITDLAWCEMQFRNKFSEQTWALPSLFKAYGRTPDWDLRQEAMIARLEELKRGTEVAGREDAVEAWAKLLRKAEGLAILRAERILSWGKRLFHA